ncbi:unnamed protein product [Phytomonas sp. Hart1]|nr:unnamed protein product [Phytomonas sp. Hart1]|eukprot:CCW70116.1 unnamed protein product [Phytomonas sp. isolate Hart1]
MEFLLVKNVSFPITPEFTRLTLLRLFSLFGEICDIVMNRTGGMASIAFIASTCAQDALVHLNGCLLFGRLISVSVAPPPPSIVPGFIVTMKPTSTLLVENESYLRILVVLRHLSGVQRIVPITPRSCTVYLDNLNIAIITKELLSAHRNCWMNNISVLFLTKRP